MKMKTLCEAFAAASLSTANTGLVHVMTRVVALYDHDGPIVYVI